MFSCYNINERLETARKLDISAESSPVFLRNGVTMACRCHTVIVLEPTTRWP